MTEGGGKSKKWFVYILRCSDDTLYCGVTTDVERRVKEHNSGTASRYTRSRRPVTLKGYAAFPDRGTAQRMEHAVKRRPSGEKLRFLEEIGERD
ncbi:MAG: GIY-YIG nuclease family protein [Deltaproteobacteria bacterium]|uniref:GIY-YIG nuclease family protein n=1 Tax=Candidatus Zymogenus saltonus TaxID=2844893 RepID=A0A9D8PPB7_9DELT|nr:GIY-YIG nuclease family protein [Candidatus Zymogenus saltonus]